MIDSMTRPKIFGPLEFFTATRCNHDCVGADFCGDCWDTLATPHYVYDKKRFLHASVERWSNEKPQTEGVAWGDLSSQ